MTHIVGYELHIKTNHSLGELMTALKAKGMEVDLEKDYHCDIIKLRHTRGTNHEFEIKLYDKEHGYKIYEVKAKTKQEMELFEEAVKSM